MAIQKTDAIILKTQPFRSSSLIVTCFTKNFGKIKGVAKGVRQEREMRGSLFELFTQIEVIYYEKTKSDLHLISDAFILESYEPVRSELQSIAYASYFADLVDQLTEFHDPHPLLFDLLHFSYSYLPSLPAEKIARIFEVRLLQEIGWLPYLDGCVKCHEKNAADFYFSPQQGAVYCFRCVGEAKDAKPLSHETLAALRYYIQHDPESSLKYSVSMKSEQGLALLMDKFFTARLHKPLRSRSFLEKIRPVLSA